MQLKFFACLNLVLFLLFNSCSTLPHSSSSLTDISSSQPLGPKYRVDLDFHPHAKNPAYTSLDKTPAPTVCFDEAHHNLAVEKGFYRPILELIQSDGYQVRHQKTPFTVTSLKQCQVLYVSAVLSHSDYETSKKQSKTSAFKSTEMTAIHNWVQGGGSLLLMTDHRPMGSAAAELLKKFHVQGSDVHVSNSHNPIQPFHDAGIFSIPESQMNLNSPIVKGRNPSERLKNIYFFYGQALHTTNSSADSFLQVGPHAKLGDAQLETNSTEPALDSTHYTSAAVALKIKKGRLVVFGDATVFTSKWDLHLDEPTGINRPGSDNVQMALNVFHWLSGILD
jgi:hypothetical protein